MKKTWSGLLVALLVCAVCPLFAGPFTVGGTISPIASPPSVANGALESDTLIPAFGEWTAFTLTNALVVDLISPGTYFWNTPGTPGSIGIGNVVNSYYFHIDPVGTVKTPAPYTGSVTFGSERILGIVILDSSLNASNYVGFGNTTYPSTAGFGLGDASSTTGDSITFTANSINFTLKPSTGADTDNFRLITQDVQIPEPATGLLLLPGLFALELLRRRRRATR